MPDQIFFEDVVEGTELSTLVKEPGTRQLVMWAGISGDYNPIHYDKDYAVSRGLPGVIVQGQLAGCFLGQLVTDWVGKQGKVARFSCSYKGMNLPGEKLTCGGKVVRKTGNTGKYSVELNLWLENSRGEKTVTGRAVVELPSKISSV